MEKIYSQRFKRNSFHHFLSFTSFSMYFRSLPNLFLFINPKEIGKKRKTWNSAWAGFDPWPCAVGLAQQPIPAQGSNAIVHGHHARLRLGHRGGTLVTGAAMAD
jgi:hypothetical protein